MKTYVYGYDIRMVGYDEVPRTITERDRYVVVAYEPLTNDEVIYKILHGICTASCCKHRKPLEQRIEKARAEFEITNVKLIREYGSN